MDDQDRLLSLLNAHGEQFLKSFPVPVAGNKRKRTPPPPIVESDDEDEWTGIAISSDDEQVDDDHDDDDGVSPNVIVFSETTVKPAPATSKGQMKNFMSSRVSKIRGEVAGLEGPSKKTDEEDEEHTHAKNDAILHRLVHTKLLSGSLDPDLNLNPAQRRKALAGRVLELAGSAKLGRGEKAVRVTERNKASKRVREGLLDKEKERRQAQLDEAKNLGNYHHTIKRLYDSDEPVKSRKRERGMAMGVGSFKGGMLRLTREDIAATQGSRTTPGRSNRGKRGGRGGRGGRGRK